MTNLKAYVWQEEDEGTGGVVFAKSGVEARRLGASQFGGGDFNEGAARRAPWADAYVATKHVPLDVMLDNGWWFDCYQCGERISEDHESDDGSEQSPIEAGHATFCTPRCLHLWGWEKIETDRASANCIEELKANLLAKAPGVTITDDKPHVYVRFEFMKPIVQQAIISFTFPGCAIGVGRYRFDKAGEEPHLTICAGDQAAWDAWRAEVKSPLPLKDHDNG